MGAVIKKELKNYFLSPIGYVVIGIFLIAKYPNIKQIIILIILPTYKP